MTGYLLEVGQLYNPKRTRWPETPHLRLSPAGCELALFFTRPAADEIQQVRKNPVSFAWVDEDLVSVLCFRFGTLPWMDAPFEPWRAPIEDRGVPVGGPGQRLLLQIVLVDAHTGIVKALRTVTWDPAFAKAVRETIRRQLASPYDHPAAGRQLGAIYQQDSRTLAGRATVRCTGGAGN